METNLSPIQEHFLKKQLITLQLRDELDLFNDPDALTSFGGPFIKEQPKKEGQFPLTKFFFDNFIYQFPFLQQNKHQDQFWFDTVRPLFESFNRKDISSTSDRENATKRKQISNKLSHPLILLYNSSIITRKDLTYLESNHLKPNDEVSKMMPPTNVVVSGENYINGININIVCVRYVEEESSKSFLRRFEKSGHFDFIISIKNELDPENRHYIARRYRQFAHLSIQLKQNLPGVKLPKFPSKNKSDSTVLMDGTETTTTLQREKMRLLLRGYLAALLGIAEVSSSSIFLSFLKKEAFFELTSSDHQDSNIRGKNDQLIIMNQLTFQENAKSSISELKRTMEEFKATLISNEHGLRAIFEEIGNQTTVRDLSAPFQNFLHWCKIQIAATIYELFLGADNSSEWFRQIKKLHNLFPYKVMYSILKYTNPIYMMQKILDLLLTSLPFSNASLLSFFFTMIINDDLRNVDKELATLKETIDHKESLRRIDAFVSNTDEQLIQRIKEEAVYNDGDLLTVILTTSAFGGVRGSDIPVDSELYANLKNYWMLLVRRKDKDLLKELWQEPELVRLIKQLLIVFYQPLIRLFKVAKIHLAFKNFEQFMNDLLKTVEYIDEHIYVLTTVQITGMIMAILNSHEESLFQFVHEIYINDKEELFGGLINWCEKFVSFLRLKFNDPTSVEIDLIDIINNTKNINLPSLTAELDILIEKVMIKRKLYDEIINSSAKNHQNNENWKSINEGISDTFQANDFGINAVDLNDLNLDFINHDNKDNVELQKKINELEKLDNELQLTEISKLCPSFRIALVSTLNRLII